MECGIRRESNLPIDFVADTTGFVFGVRDDMPMVSSMVEIKARATASRNATAMARPEEVFTTNADSVAADSAPTIATACIGANRMLGLESEHLVAGVQE